MNRPTGAFQPHPVHERLTLPYARIFHDSQEAIMVTDRYSRIVSVNPAFVAVTGYEAAEAIGRTPSLLKSNVQDAEFYAGMWACIHKDGKWQGEIWNRRKSGEVYPEWLSISSVKDDRGEVLNYVGMFSDMTSRKNTLSKLRLHAQVFSNASEGIMITDKQLKILSVNQAFTAMTGYSETEALGHTPRLLHSGIQNTYFYITMWERIHSTGHWQGEIWNKRKSGEIYPEWLSITTLRDEKGHITNYIGMFTDITERKQSEEHLKYLAHFDKLTGLPNRTFLNDLVKDATAKARHSGRKLAILFIDLDRFKMVNDSLGHSVGDKLLQQVAGRLKALASADPVVSRLGGDEFIVVLPELERPEEAAAFAGRLVNEMKKPFAVEDNELYLNASLGISLYPDHGEDFGTLIRHADLAMYEAKVQKCGYQLFNAGILGTFKRKLELENELRRAVARGQLSVQYQPQVNIASGRTEGMEALLRWHHPRLGRVSPAEFVPIAEETGLIMDIGKWVFKEVCARIGQWSSRAIDPPSVAVNLSARQFMAPDLVASIRDIVCPECDPQRIVIEITESSSMNDIDAVLPVLREFKAIGFRIAIDDFGKGYSALGYIKQFPIDILKIDKSFVRELTSDPRNAVITKAIIDMAHGLNLKVVAEGVETPGQLDALRAMNCDIVQGYLIDPPMSPDKLESRHLTGECIPHDLRFGSTP
ncbi:putative bifunctional diguanylate cyclase/phosphodiesterase [Paenibacillaceae bacterium WGS1546]|uniref:putative bifunctional diguanylate cyclase/phosphodiesterase n=1 Tax=Cohnella sp. WGS1546 TaxID=3366810 RepID=UPI00372D4896